jgi:acyl-coenzyme A thioesterase PaaI-like protein
VTADGAAEVASPALRAATPGFGPFVAAVREFTDALARTAPDDATLVELTAERHQLTTRLREFPSDDVHQLITRGVGLPGRGTPLMPPFVIDVETADELRGRVRFGAAFSNAFGTVLGGVLPLLFDDILAVGVGRQRPVPTRTAYLTVNYRRVTPLDEELTFEVSVDRVEGRKVFASARLFDGQGALTSEADALFVEVRPR